MLIITIPILLVIGFAIKIGYPGPLFYSQIREGKNGKAFRIWKLRTMVKNSKELLDNLLLKDKDRVTEWMDFGYLKNDPRIAGPIGRFARKSNLDELPQLWNICRGEMAFIGPRPLELFLAEQLAPRVRAIRNTALPGLTGLWQIGFRDEVNIQQMQRYDLLYIRCQGLPIDFYILWRTVIMGWKKN